MPPKAKPGQFRTVAQAKPEQLPVPAVPGVARTAPRNVAALWQFPNQVLKKHPVSLPGGKITLIRRKGGLPFRADKGKQRVSPSARDGAL